MTFPQTRWAEGVGEFAECYDAFVVDQFGVLHDGVTPYPGAAQALRELRRRGQRVIVLSNSGKRAAVNAQRLARHDVTPDCYDLLLTSGELTWQLLDKRDRAPFDSFGSRVLLVHPDDDRSMIAGLPLQPAKGPADADFILLASLADDQTPERLRPLLEAAAARGLPLVCANPDVLRLTPHGLAPSSGSIAALYRSIGGLVSWVGKPHALIYDACREACERWAARRICAVGDSLEHDVGGGAAAGFDTCFIAGGLHAQAFSAATADQRLPLLAQLCGASHPAPTWALPTFRWA